MELTFWGVRGTVPVSGKDITKYGGHTPCASVISSEGGIIIIDAGTGIRKLGDMIISEKRSEPTPIHLLLTHFHLDHIIGLPFFAPLYSSLASITFYAPASPENTEKYLSGIMSERYFPFELMNTKSKKIFKKLPDGNFTIGEIQVSHIPLNHPHGCVSYSLCEGDRSVIFATDTEHPENGMDEELVSFATGANFLIYDATYTPEEYESGKRGWGHSTWLEGTRVAREAKVKELYLSHFNPNHPDKRIDGIVSSARKEFPNSEGAKEGLKKIF